MGQPAVMGFAKLELRPRDLRLGTEGPADDVKCGSEIEVLIEFIVFQWSVRVVDEFYLVCNEAMDATTLVVKVEECLGAPQRSVPRPRTGINLAIGGAQE